MKAKLEMKDLKVIEEVILTNELLKGFGVDVDSLKLGQSVTLNFVIKKAIQKELKEINETR